MQYALIAFATNDPADGLQFGAVVSASGDEEERLRIRASYGLSPLSPGSFVLHRETGILLLLAAAVRAWRGLYLSSSLHNLAITL